MALPAIMGIAQAGMGIMGSIGGHNSQVDQARAQNEAMMRQYKYQLQIRDKRYKDEQQIYATKLGMYDLKMKAADRAASRAYGIEQYNQSSRIKQAAFQNLQLNQAMAKSGGAAAAAGKSGRSAQRMDQQVEADFVRNQEMIAYNLLAAEEARDYRELGIADQLQGQRNQAFADVAVAPTIPLELPEPVQNAGPSSAGMMLGIGNSILKGIGGFMGNAAPDPGNMFGGGDTGSTGFSGFDLGSSSVNFNAPTPLTSGMNFFGP